MLYNTCAGWEPEAACGVGVFLRCLASEDHHLNNPPQQNQFPEPSWLAPPAVHHKCDFSGRGECCSHVAP